MMSKPQASPSAVVRPTGRGAFLSTLRNIVTGAFALVLIALGFVRRAKRQALRPGIITAVYFHNPNGSLFDFCVRWLMHNGFHFVSAETVAAALYEGRRVPPGAIWLSFDDGYRSTLDNVMPVVKQLNIPVTMFPVTQAVETGVFWFRAARLVSRAFAERLWGMQSAERLRSILPLLHTYMGVSQSLSASDLKELAASGLVTFGSHMATHPDMRTCSDAELDTELQSSRDLLHTWTGGRIDVFSYPRGNYDTRCLGAVRRAGFRLAVTTEVGFIDRFSHPLRLSRFAVADNISRAEAVCCMVGVWLPFITKLKRLARSATAFVTPTSSPLPQKGQPFQNATTDTATR